MELKEENDMECYTVEDLREKVAKAENLEAENKELKAELSKLSEENFITKKSLEKLRKENGDMCLKYYSIYDKNVDLNKKVACMESTIKRQENTIVELRVKMSRPLTVDEMLKTLSQNGDNSVMIGLK